MKKRKDRILQKINDQINVDFLDVIDESHLHAGHLDFGDETHFKIRIKSDDFNGKTLVEIHRIINHILKDEFSKSGLHALSIDVIKN